MLIQLYQHITTTFLQTLLSVSDPSWECNSCGEDKHLLVSKNHSKFCEKDSYLECKR